MPKAKKNKIKSKPKVKAKVKTIETKLETTDLIFNDTSEIEIPKRMIDQVIGQSI